MVNANMMPDFLIAGAPRCGTKNLTAYLVQHPQICMPHHLKEIHYFDRHYDKGRDWYASHFEACKSEKIKGEKTATYMTSEKYANRITNDLPEIKLIFLLRNPVNRAYSEYWLMVRNGKEVKEGRPIPSHRAIKRKNNMYVQRGKYLKQLKYFSAIPEEQKYIVISEEYWNSPFRTIKQIFEFLGVDTSFTPGEVGKIHSGKTSQSNFLASCFFNRFTLPLLKYKSFNKTLRCLNEALHYEKDYPPLSEDDKQYLKKIFRKENDKLEEYLERDLSCWK